MIRTFVRKPTFLAVSALLASVATVGCNNSNGAKTGPGDDLGSAQFALTVPGATISSIHYNISDLTPLPGTSVKSEDVAVPGNGPSASFLVSGLSPDHYRVDLSATADVTAGGSVSCTGSAEFDISAGLTTHVHINLLCSETRANGNVAINANVSFNDCPYITSYLLSSTQVAPGGTISLNATGGDRQASLIPGLGFAWADTSTPAGAIAPAGAAAATFTCPAGTGAHVLTVTVSNGVSTDVAACIAAGARESITVLCVNPACGNGHLDPGESCDRGLDSSAANYNGKAGGDCSYTCSSNTCGNGSPDPGEACDNGSALNGTPGNRCSLSCTVVPVCGDSITDAPETCDDGNTTNFDGCSSTCQSQGAVCGNGAQEAGEACDDGNASNTDGCVTGCHLAACGDTFVQTGVETCDDGNTANFDGCSATCQTQAAVCGNGHVESGEACDDGNLVNLDGCSATCVVETACLVCEESHRGPDPVTGSPRCSVDMGCESLSNTPNAVSASINPLGLSDRQLCQNLLTCLRANPSCSIFASSVSCMCGTATGTACTDPVDPVGGTGPNGPCQVQAFQAAKTSSSSTAGTRFTSTAFPSGHATQVVACDKNFCGAAVVGGACAP